jgi:Uma2 family endonuclease
VSENETRAVLISDLDDAEHYEIIDGVKVRLPPRSVEATAIASDLTTALTNYGLAQNLGKAHSEMRFHLPLPLDRNPRPDVAFVPFSRWPKNRPRPATNAWEGSDNH